MAKIRVEFPDDRAKDFPKGTSVLEALKQSDWELEQRVVAAKVNGKAIDLAMPLQEDSLLEPITTDNPEGMEIYWHSTSHIMAHAVKELFPEAKFGIGPAIDSGFYYDIDVSTSLTPEDLARIEAKMQDLIAADRPFLREELTKLQAVKLFKSRGEDYKLELLEELDEKLSVYREGDFVDLCTGPHIPSTGRVKAFKLLSVAGAYWRGDEKRPMLQRIYGISFPQPAQLEDYLQKLEEAKRRDHRRLAKTSISLASVRKLAPA